MSSNISARLQALLQNKIRVYFVGPPGTAKTGRMIAAAKALNYRVVVIRLSLCERIDLGGCLVPDQAKGVTVQLPLQTLHELRNSSEPTLLILDDLGQGPTDVQAGSMSLFDKGALPDNVVIWGATNRPADAAGANRLCEPLRSRFDLAFAIATPGFEPGNNVETLGSWKDEVDNFVGYCQQEDHPVTLWTWHRSTVGETLYNWKPSADPATRFADFRSWETVARLQKAGLATLQNVSAALGRGVAARYLAFVEMAAQLPTPDEVFASPESALVPTDAGAMHLICGMLSRHVTPKNAVAFFSYIARLPRPMQAYAVIDASNRLGAAVIAKTPAWQKFVVDNSDLFQQG